MTWKLLGAQSAWLSLLAVWRSSRVHRMACRIVRQATTPTVTQRRRAGRPATSICWRRRGGQRLDQ